MKTKGNSKKPRGKTLQRLKNGISVVDRPTGQSNKITPNPNFSL